MPRAISNEFAGKYFGRLFVLGDSGLRQNRNVLWKCVCECGAYCTARGSHLRGGTTVSCGCYRTEVHTTHGLCNSGLYYQTWAAMIQRCTNQKHQAYKDYGARGITVCSRWMGPEGYLCFLADMGFKKSPDLTLERVNNDEGYSSENCCWATRKQQTANRRKKELA